MEQHAPQTVIRTNNASWRAIFTTGSSLQFLSVLHLDQEYWHVTVTLERVAGVWGFVRRLHDGEPDAIGSVIILHEETAEAAPNRIRKYVIETVMNDLIPWLRHANKLIAQGAVYAMEKQIARTMSQKASMESEARRLEQVIARDKLELERLKFEARAAE